MAILLTITAIAHNNTYLDKIIIIIKYKILLYNMSIYIWKSDLWSLKYSSMKSSYINFAYVQKFVKL